jgi:hypothetical protein
MDLLSSASVYALETTKMGIKVWYLACSVTKSVWNFAVYCGKEGDG